MPTAGPSALPDLPAISSASFTPPPSVSPLQPSPFPPDSLPLSTKPTIRVTPPPHASGPSPDPLKTQMKPWPSPTLTPKHPSVSKQSGTAPGGQTSLTYDSFWSTHSAGRTFRSFGSFSSRGSMGDVATSLTTDVG
ncbi:hypothetical protein BDZ89DRAFT_1140966 [Hymenopellis radicata]|nr:hypothetical protein BDZ89DRAFT_1140966 [Hymenopellis radicata]